MRRKYIATALFGCAAAVGVIATATPAYALDAGAYRDNFNGRSCDALVYVSDTTSSGKVEAFGGFSCPSNVKLIGHLTVVLYRNGTQVCSSGHGYNLVTTDSEQCAITDNSGNQRWKARLRITTPDTTGGVNIVTGEIST